MSDTTVKSIYLDLLIAANELELSELTENMQEYLISHETDWIRNNFFKIFQITEKSKPFTRLENFCQEIFNTNPAMILNSDGFLELEADFLISLFKRDDIVLDEITIWESVIRWGIAQIKLNTDVSQWTNRDFIRLKKAVKNLIPHIRFFNISGMDHRTKIRPYKKILPKELKEEIKDYFFAQVPPKKFCKLPLRATKSEPNESVVNILDHVTITSIESVLMDIRFGSDLQWFVGVCAPRSYKTPIYESALFSLTNFEVFKVEKKIYKNDSCKNDDSYNDSYKNDDNDGNVKKAMIEYDSDDTVESDSDYIDIDKL
ncbi:20041_t:CDS:2 [Gigaspora margarita]|uniref:20041_t:CDS:1 n=1 Tax=Gigaspora margarita TaxID=4874 RepID=A0ABN7UUT9_GIGMA|nr:20041_t:CDS:2 [Gigaspora margarita]